MRQGPNSKRPRGRSNNRKHVNSRNQSYDSNGPDVKVRGNAQQVVEKYLMLARDASSAGDRIMAESYYQHAEHYYRILNAAMASEQRNAIASAAEARPPVDGPERNSGQETEEAVANGSGPGRRRNGRQAAAAQRDPADTPQPALETAAEDVPAAEA